MAYIDRVKSPTKTFYYLGKTLRVGPNKWKKIRVKLGSKKTTKEEIASKLKELKLDEYKIYNENYIGADKLEIIDDFKEVYQNYIKKVPKTIVEKEESDFVIRFTYNSNAIEGNRLTLRETFLVIKEKQIPSGAPAKDYNEAINGREALDFVNEHNNNIEIFFNKRKKAKFISFDIENDSLDKLRKYIDLKDIKNLPITNTFEQSSLNKKKNSIVTIESEESVESKD